MKNKLKEFWQSLNSPRSGDIHQQCMEEFHKDFFKCSKCESENVTHTVDFKAETGMSTVSLTCNDCCHAEILQGNKEFEDDRRFVLSDLYMGNDTAPIRDNLLRPEYDKMFYTEIVEEMNYLHKMNKELWEENRQLRHWNECLAEKRHKELEDMTVKIDRYNEIFLNKDGNKAKIIDKLHSDETIVFVETRNPILTKKLIHVCMEDLNKGFETNDECKNPISDA